MPPMLIGEDIEVAIECETVCTVRADRRKSNK
jgi:hypothetical protein